eukprot:scaffold104765_cov11-Tisochrysis_lutea.AAC.1
MSVRVTSVLLSGLFTQGIMNDVVVGSGACCVPPSASHCYEQSASPICVNPACNTRRMIACVFLSARLGPCMLCCLSNHWLRPWAEKYAADQDAFFADYAGVSVVCVWGMPKEPQRLLTLEQSIYF